MVKHYGTVIIPARPRKPRDKTLHIARHLVDDALIGNKAGRAGTATAATLDDGLPLRNFPEAPLQSVTVAFFDETLVSPVKHCGLADIEPLGYLAPGEQPAPAQPLEAARKLVGEAYEGDLLRIECLALPRASAAIIQYVGDFPIAVMIEKLVDFGDKFGF
jgi:hypothetical protein